MNKNRITVTAAMERDNETVSVVIPQRILRSLLTPAETTAILARRARRTVMVAQHTGKRPGVYRVRPTAAHRINVRGGDTLKRTWDYLKKHKQGATRHQLRDDLNLTPGAVSQALRELRLKRAVMHVPPSDVAA